MPGTLPVINQKAVEYAVKAGFALGCDINKFSVFDRKNYFYPDLPKAYQISQLERPLCINGSVKIETSKGEKVIRINRIHLEEDAGKLVHDDFNAVSLADYNRCGVPLIEIVTEPDFRTVEEVQDFVVQIGQRLKYAGVCDAKMEQGSLRVDVNISLMPYGSDEFGTRAEIKNLNSVKSIGRAIEYEIMRQSEILDKGGKVLQETRRYNENHDDTKAMRSKEEAHDYRYFPEPDIPPVLFTDDEIDAIRDEMPELPNARLERYTKSYGLPEDDARLIIAQKEFSDFYDEAVTVSKEYKLVSNLMLGEISHLINETGADITEVRFSPADVAKTAEMAAKGVISKGAAKDIISILFSDGGDPEKIAKEHGFIMDNDASGLDAIIDDVLAANSDAVEKYKAGNEKLFGFIMGQAIKACGKGANPGLIKQALSAKLK
jgi:aspartyl-tRNA(Asn)/glutamyl-tRNA(Gln) amidotransferase subunit B